jgi:hypothetical protein
MARLASVCPMPEHSQGPIEPCKDGSWTKLAESTRVGIDVSKDRLDVHRRPSGEAFAVRCAGKGLKNHVDRLAALDVPLTVLEASGGFETTVAAALASASLPLAVVNPRQIRNFAKAVGKLDPRPMRSMPKPSRLSGP